MADSATTRHALLLMETGTHDNSWGVDLNTVIQQIENFARGTATIATTGGTTTLTTTTSREPIQRVTGVLVSNATIEVPAAATSWWVFKNETTGAFTVTVKVTGQTGVVVPQDSSKVLRCNGTDVVDTAIPISNNRADITASVGGTVDAITATFLPAWTAWRTGIFFWVSPGANTVTNPTINPHGLGAKTIKKAASAALAAGDTGASGYLCMGYYNGTDVLLLNPNVSNFAGGVLTVTTSMSGKSFNQAKGANIASAATCDIWAPADGNLKHVTGTTGITSFGTAPQAGAEMTLIFDGAVLLTDGANLNVPGGNYTTAAGDEVKVLADTTTAFTLTIERADGHPVIPNITLATEQATTSGTSKDFTGIPAGTKRITIMLVGVSTNGTSNLLIQLGDSGGFETTGYVSSAANPGVVVGNSTIGLIVTAQIAAAFGTRGSVTLNLEDASDFTWVSTGITIANNTDQMCLAAGSKSLSAELTQVRLTTVNGTDTFDAGAVSISYE